MLNILENNHGLPEHAQLARAVPKAAQLTRKQVMQLLALGGLFWWCAAMIVRYGSPLGFFSGTALLALYALAIPISGVFLAIAVPLCKLQPAVVVRGVAVMIACATLLDGVALTLCPSLYGTNSAVVLAGAAWILGGVGAGTIGGFCVERHGRRRPQQHGQWAPSLVVHALRPKRNFAYLHFRDQRSSARGALRRSRV